MFVISTVAATPPASGFEGDCSDELEPPSDADDTFRDEPDERIESEEAIPSIRKPVRRISDPSTIKKTKTVLARFGFLSFKVIGSVDEGRDDGS